MGLGQPPPPHPLVLSSAGGMAQRGPPNQLWNEVVVSKETSSQYCSKLQNGLAVCVCVSSAWGYSWEAMQTWEDLLSSNSQSVSLAPGLSSSDLLLSSSPASSPQGLQL